MSIRCRLNWHRWGAGWRLEEHQGAVFRVSRCVRCGIHRTRFIGNLWDRIGQMEHERRRA